jgi:Tfp pilus assembly protein PilN
MRAVNLIPSDQRSGAGVGAGRSEGAAYAVLALLVVIAGLAVLYGKATRDVSSNKTKAATLNQQAQRAQSQASALAPYTTFVSLRKQREQAVASLVDTRFDWAHAIHEFGRVLSNQVMLTSLDGTVGATGGSTAATAPTPPAPAGSTAAASAVSTATPSGSVPTFTIQGCATSQKAVADTIQRLRLIDGVSEVTLQSSTRSDTGGGAGAAAGSAGGGCGPKGPVFSMTVTFDPLPSASASAAAAKTSSVSDTGTPGGGSQ